MIPWESAVTYNLVTGTHISGDVSDTWYEDANHIYDYEASGSPGFVADYTFENIPYDDSTSYLHLHWTYSYDGNPAHRIIAQVWNYDTLGWDAVTGDLDDFNNTGGADNKHIFNIGPGLNLPSIAPYVSGGQMIWRQDHVSPGNINHIVGAEWLHLEEGYEPSS